MIQNLPQDFLDALNSTSRKPIQLMQIDVDGKTHYLSDTIYQGYLPFVESFGDLIDSSNIESLFGGQSLGIKTCNVVLIISDETRPFILSLLSSGIENTPVRLYQTFSGLLSEPVLIDSFVIQNPIKYSESSILLELDLVSPLMASNPRLYPIAANDKQYPVVIGSVSGLPLIDMKTGQFAYLAMDIKENTTGWVHFDDVSRMNSSGYMYIGEEKLYYSSKSGKQLYITSRGTPATAHLQGEMVAQEGAYFDYAICCGSVQSISIQGATGGTVYPNSNPAMVRFSQWPPNGGNLENRPPTYSTKPANDSLYGTYDSNPLGGNIIWGYEMTLNQAYMADGFHMIQVPVDVSPQTYKVTAKVNYRVTSVPSGGKAKIVFAYATVSVPTSVSQLVGLQTVEVSSPDPISVSISVDCGELTYNQLREYGGEHWHFYVYIEGSGADGVKILVNKPWFLIEYTIQYQDSVHSTGRVFTPIENVTATVTGAMGANPTPPKLVKYFIENHASLPVGVNVDDFNSEHSKYAAKGYYFNGLFPAGIRLHDAIKKALMEGLARLKYSQGETFFLSYFDDIEETIDSEILPIDWTHRSRNKEHYSTENIKNKIMVHYDYNLDQGGGFLGTYTVSDSDSISKYSLKDEVRELQLINSYSVAKMHGDRMLEFLKDAPKVFSVNVFLSKGFRLEKGDKISIPDFVEKRRVLTGNLLSVARTFGQGKTQLINSFNLMMSHFKEEVIFRLYDGITFNEPIDFQWRQRFRDSLIFADDNFFVGNFLQMDLKDSITFADNNIHTGKPILIEIKETINFKDDQVEIRTCGGYGSCGYGVRPYGA